MAGGNALTKEEREKLESELKGLIVSDEPIRTPTSQKEFNFFRKNNGKIAPTNSPAISRRSSLITL